MSALAQKEFNSVLEEYLALPETVKAELIDGEIYMMASPSRLHQELLMALSASIFNHIKSGKGSCKVYPAPFSVKLEKDRDNYLEPDISVICDESKLTDAGCEGAPDWIVEIASPSDLRHDYIRKLNLYEEAGVREYWIVNPMEETVVVYLMEQEGLQLKHYTFTETIPSGIFEDFQVNFGELLGAE